MTKRIFLMATTICIYLISDYCYSHISNPERDGNQEGWAEKISLAGTWKFRLDSLNTGVKERWYLDDFEEVVKLPGTTDKNKKGIYKDEWRDDRLSRVYYWKGAAWYQKGVDIPEHWADKNVLNKIIP